MTAPQLVLAQPDRSPAGRFEWERIVRRIVLPERYKLLALVLATYANQDGSRVRPGERALAGVLSKSERTVRRLLGDLEDSYKLIEMTARGGGRGGSGRTTEYRLTIPVDLLDRVELLPPNEHPTPESPDTMMSGQSAPSSVDSPVDNTDRPDTQMSGESYPQPQETAESPDTQMSPENDFHRTNNTVTDQLTGQNQSIDRTPRVSDYQETNHLKRPTTSRTPSATHDRARTSRPDHEPPRPRSPHDRPADALDALLTFTPTVRRPPPSTSDGEP